MLNKKSYKNILIYLLFYNQKSSKTIYFNLRNNNFIIIFKCKLQSRRKTRKIKKKKWTIFKNKKDIKNIKRQNKGNIA
mgnify:FL=1